MYAFQSIAFVFEILLRLALASAIVIFSDIIAMDTKGSDVKYIISKAISIIIALFIFMQFILPYLKDVPKLVTRKLTYSVEYVYNVERPRKSFTEYVEVEGKTLKFFFTSKIKTHRYYKIGYLPNSNRGIYVGELGYSKTSEETKVSFPAKELFSYIGLLAGIGLIIVITPFLRWRFLILSCILSYPVTLYLFISHGIKSGVWISEYNRGFPHLVGQLLGILVIMIFNFIERRKDEDIPTTLFFTQILAIGNMASFIYNVLKW